MSGKTVVTISRSIAHRRFGCCWQATVAATLLLGCGGMLAGIGARAIAADPPTATAPTNPNLEPDLTPLNLNILSPGNLPPGVVTASTISETGLTIPSLWWLQEQVVNEDTYGSKLLQNWLAFPNSGNQPGRVDLIVNRQFWSLLDYLARYAFIHAFGEVARDYGYNLRVFDGQAVLLGASTCDFRTINIDALQQAQLAKPQDAASTATSPATLPSAETASLPCSILLESTGKGGLRGRSSPLGASAPKALDTAPP